MRQFVVTCLNEPAGSIDPVTSAIADALQELGIACLIVGGTEQLVGRVTGLNNGWNT